MKYNKHNCPCFGLRNCINDCEQCNYRELAKEDEAMKIKVKNDGKTVFVGNALQWLEDNQGDSEVVNMIDECRKTGYAQGYFLSGKWEVFRIFPADESMSRRDI